MNVDILKVLCYCGPLKLTHIMQKANFNCSVLEEYLDFLIKQGLVEVKNAARERKTYAVTQRGIAVLEQFREITKVLPLIEEKGNKAGSQRPYLY
jgi:predicted transcriptional regulator